MAPAALDLLFKLNENKFETSIINNLDLNQFEPGIHTHDLELSAFVERSQIYFAIAEVFCL